MVVAASYPLLEVFWTMLIFFAFVVWIWILFVVIGDILRRRDISGVAKVAWVILLLILPYLGVFIYLIAEHTGMTERTLERQQAAQAEIADYVRSVASSDDPSAQISKAKALLDDGAITPEEYERIKGKALAA
jgi:energy-coupling factor transporter transmembrane protein EcfT